MSYTVPRLFHHFIDVFTTIWQDNDAEFNVMIEEHDASYQVPYDDPNETLNIAVENLHLLADLIEAHYISREHSRLQKRAMKEARQLAQMYTAERDKPSLNYVLDVQFEVLARDLMTLKQCNLITEAGNPWSDIMRKPIRTAALAIKSYQAQLADTKMTLNCAIN